MKTSPSHLARALGLLVLTLASGCSSLITPHHAYAPLLDHAGQLDISARAGAGVPGAAGVSLDMAYAPIDHLELVGGGDFNIGDDKSHFAGHLGLGTFVREDVFRLEAIIGLYGGSAEGTGFRLTSSATDSYALGARYLMPYAQVFAGFERRHFEIAGGLRVSGFLGDVTMSAIAPSPPHPTPQVGYERAYLEPTATVRIPIDWFRIDFQLGVPFVVAGDAAIADLVPTTADEGYEETGVMWYIAVGVGFQIDTIEQEPEIEPVPVDAPTPAYAPVYTPAAQPPVIVVP